MIRWVPDTCHCIIIYEDDFQNAKLIKRCRSHNNPSQTAQHNRVFSALGSRNPSEAEQATNAIRKALEKAKPQFQRN